ncbi:MAG: hypothetical protein GWN84_20545 [Gammaproteobacteria bacterium]|nr:hypothetical protein [Gammaproteobacteria bacterium]NIR85151.1 hypothetical protein [Gammaproteobacteria bacterium]NIU06200.1 hypothetical protein [Gammaproteobacteria bacterium]NIX87473.1 hypothetical protein [Gammaproteobacteria bacterium]
MGELLYVRHARLVIHRLEITGLRMAFQIERSIKKEPNTAELRVWNLNRDHQAQLQEQGVIPVRLEAGYLKPSILLSTGTEAALAGIGLEPPGPADLPLLFQGELRQAFTGREGSDLVTTISSGDGEKKRQRQRTKLSFRPGLRLRKIIQDLASAAGVGLGNALSAIDGIADLEITTGVASQGPALEQLEQMLEGAGFETSVQNGDLQVLGAGKALRGTAVLLNEETGLVGSPEPGQDGKVKARCLLRPGVEPGRRVKLESRFVAGHYRVEKYRAVGDTHGTDWYNELELGRIAA